MLAGLVSPTPSISAVMGSAREDYIRWIVLEMGFNLFIQTLFIY